jgi:hypothetical protein
VPGSGVTSDQDGCVDATAPGKGPRVSSSQSRRQLVYLHTQLLINEILPDEPDPAAANALQEGLGGQFGEMRTMICSTFSRA